MVKRLDYKPEIEIQQHQARELVKAGQLTDAGELLMAALGDCALAYPAGPTLEAHKALIRRDMARVGTKKAVRDTAWASDCFDDGDREQLCLLADMLCGVGDTFATLHDQPELKPYHPHILREWTTSELLSGRLYMAWAVLDKSNGELKKGRGTPCTWRQPGRKVQLAQYTD